MIDAVAIELLMTMAQQRRRWILVLALKRRKWPASWFSHSKTYCTMCRHTPRLNGSSVSAGVLEFRFYLALHVKAQLPPECPAHGFRLGGHPSTTERVSSDERSCRLKCPAHGWRRHE